MSWHAVDVLLFQTWGGGYLCGIVLVAILYSLAHWRTLRRFRRAVAEARKGFDAAEAGMIEARTRMDGVFAELDQERARLRRLGDEWRELIAPAGPVPRPDPETKH